MMTTIFPFGLGLFIGLIIGTVWVSKIKVTYNKGKGNIVVPQVDEVNTEDTNKE